MHAAAAANDRALRVHFARDRANRYADYLRHIDHPRESAGVTTRALAPKADQQQLRILAGGDSWFKYPLGPISQGFQDGVIYQLEQLLGYPICNMAEPGEQVRQMLGLEMRQELIYRLSDYNVNYDALLFPEAATTWLAISSASG